MIKNIVVKPSHKCSNTVVMNMGDYENACLEIFTNIEYYKKLPYNPNDQYKQSATKETDKL